MSINGTFSPDEPASEIVRERTIFIEQIMNGVGYGVALTLYCHIVVAFARSRRRYSSAGSRALLGLNSLMIILSTLYLAGCIVLSTKMFIDDRNFPGGPDAYLIAEYSFPVTMMANAAYPIEIWLCDGLMIYRCLLVYGFDFRVIVFPVLLLMGSFAMGSIILNQQLVGKTGFWAATTINFAVPFFSLSMALNFTATVLIVLRLMFIRRQVYKALGPDRARDRVSVSAMFIESATITTTVSLIFLVPYARGHPVSNVFQGLVFYAQV